MTVKDVNLDERFLAIPEGKNSNSVRQIPAHSACLDVLRPLVEGRADDEYVFSSLSGGGYDGKLSKTLSNRGWRFKNTHFASDPNWSSTTH